MSLLPKTSAEFSSKEYWESFFKKSSSFEWYGNYFDLCGVLSRYLKKSDEILVPGCGNSALSEQLYDNAFIKISNIDISETVIKQMKKKNAHRSEMTYDVMDLKSMTFSNDHFSIILDKGTLDAIMTDDSEECHATVDAIFSEYYRVLKNGGRYICVTLAQDQILKKLVKYFTENHWIIRVHNVQVGIDSKVENAMPVFAFVMTKFQKLPRLILELCLEDNAKPTRVETTNEIVESVKALQYYAILRTKLGKKVKNEDDHIQVELFSNYNITLPRYKLFIVDNLHYKPNHYFAIFIVPQGKECDWLFASKEGRESLGKSANFQRLIVTLLNEEHEYENMQKIQDELSTKALELAPPNLPDSYKVPFLSEGTGIGERIIRYKGQSDFTGPYIIEDYIHKNDEWYRHLIFLAQGRIVQCEVKLKPKSGNKRELNKNEIQIPDFSFLASEYAESIATFLALQYSPRSEFNLLVLGFGGGTLPMFVNQNFPSSNIHSVEIDKSIVEIAQNWFGVPKSTDRLKITVGDGLEFVNDLVSSENHKIYDTVVIDIDSKDLTTGISCPPEPFVSMHYLESVKIILSPNGVLLINLLCRNTNFKHKVYETVCSMFPFVCVSKATECLNEVLICFKAKPELKAQNVKKGKSKNKKKSKQKLQHTKQDNDNQKTAFSFDVLKQSWLNNLKEWNNWRNVTKDRKISVDMNEIASKITILSVGGS